MKIEKIYEKLLENNSNGDYLGEVDCLKKLHSFINAEVFNNCLRKDIYINIENTNKFDWPDNWAMYIRKKPYINMPAILFDHDLFDKLNEAKDEAEEISEYPNIVVTKQDIIEEIVITMFHEMIHQYCHENGIDDSNHNDSFMDIAYKYGLWSQYENNHRIFEWIADDNVRSKLGFRDD